jgi:hypothetical protein
MDFEKAKQDILCWVTRFVEQPNKNLNGWPPCPYARRARIEKKFEIKRGVEPYYDLMHVDLGSLDVVAFVYSPSDFAAKEFENLVQRANQGFLQGRDLIALPDHPHSPEIVNGVVMNQGQWAIVFVQQLTKLDSHAKTLADRGFYHEWPESYLEQLFEGRSDPRR